MNIYVGNLFYGMSEDELRDQFASYGEVSSVRIITDRETRRSKGFGFVDMPNDEEAKRAIEELNGKEVSGRTLRVNEARPREERPRNRY
ncbi:MAG: RNA-binding protein [Epsilonproteobacteria bacterium]|nr:RNA-binding protein [Campylobacterota bacterium]